MKLIPTKFDLAFLIEPRVFEDARGFFFESYNRAAFQEAGIDTVFVQDNHSKSCAGTVRGMHFQTPPRAQDKLVRAIVGRIFDVIVDLRHGSPTYGQWEGHELSADNHRMLFVPKGFAHGFCALSETAEILYKCSDFYAPETAKGFAWNDPTVAIDWPVETPTLSTQDQQHGPLAGVPACFHYHS